MLLLSGRASVEFGINWYSRNGCKSLNQSYYRNVNPDLLDRIPLNIQAVLEVGCGTGALGGAYKLRNPQVHYIGVEEIGRASCRERV